MRKHSRPTEVSCPNCGQEVVVFPGTSVVSCIGCSYAIKVHYNPLLKFKYRKIL